MEQRDLIKDQIEQLGKVLAKILSNFLGMADKNNVSNGIETTNQQLKNELNIDIEKILSLAKEELKNYLSTLQLNEEHLETLSEYFEEIGIREIKTNKAKSKLYLEKAIELLDIANEISSTFSLNRITKKNEIKNVLQHNK